MANFKITYLAEDGEVRWFNIEADDKENAEYKAYTNDAGNIGSDGINKIIKIEEN